MKNTRFVSMLNAISTDFNNADLLRRISEGGVSFVLVGGGAVAAHGCRGDAHLPELDILIDPTIDNAQRVLAVLSAAGMQLRIKPTDLAGPKKQLPIKQLLFDMDILTPAADESFTAILERSDRTMIDDLEVSVIGRDDLIVMKREVVSKQEPGSEKHRRDLDCLEQQKAAS